MYNNNKMPISPDVMRILLVLCLAGMALLAAFYLRGRKLTFTEYLGWGLLAILLPILGPFLVILSHPGRPARPAHLLSRKPPKRSRPSHHRSVISNQ